MSSVEMLRQEAIAHTPEEFATRWGPWALVLRPEAILLDRITPVRAATEAANWDGGHFRQLLAMLRQFRELDVHFLPPGTTRFLLGRSPQCQVALNDASVSKEHAVIVPGPDGPMVQDLGSRNGTTVNGIPVSQPTKLDDGDNLRLASVQFVFVTSRTLHAQLLALG